jgi:hypothetical protein
VFGTAGEAAAVVAAAAPPASARTATVAMERLKGMRASCGSPEPPMGPDLAEDDPVHRQNAG